MSNDINNMDVKQLRNEVQLLRDELAIMKRKYEDIIYNLDTDNFSQRLVKQGENMYTKIEQTADSISLQAEKITENEEKMAELSVKAGEISSIARKNISAHFESSEAPTKDNTSTKQKSMLCLYEGKYYYYNDIKEEWEEYPEDGLQTMFVQDGEKFALYGDVLVDGSCIITDTLTFNSEDKPVQVQYSVDGTPNSWHYGFVADEDKFMRLKIGADWTDAMSIVGKDGEPGQDGAPGELDYSQVHTILKNNYKIERTTINGNSVVTATLHSAELYSPNIYGENITLVAQNDSNANIYNNLYLTPTGMSLVNNNGVNEKDKFHIDLGDDTDNKTIKMRLGAGVNDSGLQALNIEKHPDMILVGTYKSSNDFVGMSIMPSTGVVTFHGTVQGIGGSGSSVAVFGS